MGHGGDFFLVLNTLSTPDIIRDRWHARCSEKKKKDLLLGEPEKITRRTEGKVLQVPLCCQKHLPVAVKCLIAFHRIAHYKGSLTPFSTDCTFGVYGHSFE